VEDPSVESEGGGAEASDSVCGSEVGDDRMADDEALEVACSARCNVLKRLVRTTACNQLKLLDILSSNNSSC
jgi:hypothetical protein